MTSCPFATVKGTIIFNYEDVKAKFASLGWYYMETAFAQHPPIYSIDIEDLDGAPEAVNQLLDFVAYKLEQHPEQLREIKFRNWMYQGEIEDIIATRLASIGSRAIHLKELVFFAMIVGGK